MSSYGNLSVMVKVYKLICKNFYPGLYNCCCCSTLSNLDGTWLEALEAQEKEYFLRKSHDYLNYIQTQIKHGKTIDDLIQENRIAFKNKAHIHNSDIRKCEDCFVTKNEEFINYIKSELTKGKPIHEIFNETQKILAEIRRGKEHLK